MTQVTIPILLGGQEEYESSLLSVANIIDVEPRSPHSTGWVYDPVYLDHDTGPGHPERSDRLRAVVAGLKAAGLWDEVEHLVPDAARGAQIETVHDSGYVRRVREACARGLGHIDTPDSVICQRSYDVALLAAGGVLVAVDAVMGGRCRNAFCAVRPPGHHAERDRSMGFCLFNNVAIAAEYLLREHGLGRVAIVDFDVHHGNGTQHIFEDRADVLFISLHGHPRTLYPGTGFAHEVGTGVGEGATLNVPLAPGSGDAVYRARFEEQVVPVLEGFRPEVLLVSAGFDAAAADPLAEMEVTAEGFGWMTERLASVADQHCGGRLISTLEGGYDLEALGGCVAAHLGALKKAGQR